VAVAEVCDGLGHRLGIHEREVGTSGTRATRMITCLR
jgi:hypothetical protein